MNETTEEAQDARRARHAAIREEVASEEAEAAEAEVEQIARRVVVEHISG